MLLVGFLGAFCGRAFFGFLGAIARPLDVNDLAAVDESVYQCDDAGGVRENVWPFTERLVSCAATSLSMALVLVKCTV
jgi:hypothetical protein